MSSTSAQWRASPDSSRARLLLVGAHPDDETIGAGRLVADHAGPVRAVVLSAGERCVVDDRLDPDALALRRLEEWRAAVGHLGAEPVETPRWPDSALEDHEAAMLELMVSLLDEVDVVVGLWRHDPHPDHGAAGRACVEAAAQVGIPVLEYPVWAPYWMEPAELRSRGYRICSRASSPASGEARERALQEYTSQTRSLLPGVEPVVPPGLLACHDRQLLSVPDA